MAVRDVAERAYREALPVLAVSAVGGLFAGLVLGGMRGDLREVSGLLVLVPALLATRGNVYGAMGAKLSTALHQGLIDANPVPDDRRVYTAVSAAMLNGVVISVFASVVTYAVLVALSRPSASLATLAGVAFVAGVLSGIALTIVVVAAVFAGYRRGLNPDTLVGPVVTTTGDVFGMAALLAAVRLVLALGGG
ncbi:magnesium transporter [Halorussus aquaticus]|uniref:Magnesium transporter n=1 Tax=Halorussus aquaticus TaxID=2953748 RepID=A0ABD5Q6U0_9EURY|nr:magnesium transporter [Halorussus aquaticus]